jgi:alpha-mannosidase
MSVDEILKLLDEKIAELGKPLPLEFRFPPKEPRHPLEECPKKSWPVFNPLSLKLKKNDKNWFYAEIDFPKQKNGIALHGRKALCFVNGWVPFTAWLDGQELWKETHAWHATGPIADPFPVPMYPGRKHQLVLCIEPTELNDMGLPIVAVSIHPEVAMDLAWDLQATRMQILLADALAKTNAEKRLVERAVSCLDVRALRANRWSAVEASVTRMETTLAPLSRRAGELTVHLIGHAHIDMDWLWTWSDTVQCIRRDFKATADLMDKYLELTFTHSQVPTYDIVRRMDPDVFRKVQRRVDEGRWENAAGTWVEGDLNMADGEAIARHMLYATDWTKKHLNSKAMVFWAPDTFGHPGNMPQLARLGELNCYFHMRCNPGKPDIWPTRKWTGIDGTSITAFTTNYNGDLAPLSVMSEALRCLRNGLKNSIHLWGLGDHGGAMSRWQLEMLKRYRFRTVVPTIRFSTMKELLAAVDAEKVRLPGNKGETPSSFEGCFSVHSQIKRYNRRGENTLLAAEALTAMARLDCRDVLREAWKPILFNQFHDIFDGCAVHDTYINAHKRAEGSLKSAAYATHKAVTALVRPTKKGNVLTVLNPTGFERTEPVRARLPRNAACLADGEGHLIPVQKLRGEHVFIAGKLPAFGHATYRILTRATAGLDGSKITVEEDGPTYRVESHVATSGMNRLVQVHGWSAI